MRVSLKYGALAEMKEVRAGAGQISQIGPGSGQIGAGTDQRGAGARSVQLRTSSCSRCAGWCLAWFPLPSVCEWGECDAQSL